MARPWSVPVVLVLAALVLAGAVGGPVGASTGPDGSPATDRSGAVDGGAFSLQEFDRSAFAVTVYGNGSARWTFRYFQTLSNESERTDFEAFAEEFESTETTLFTDFVNRSRELTAAGESATGREMSATDFSRSATVGDLGNRGIVELSFRWEGFARTDGDRVVVGDTFDGGLYIRADQRLVLSRGPGLRFEDVAPEPDSVSGGTVGDSETLTWAGERSFTDNRPRVVLVAAATAAPSPTDAGGDGETGTEPVTTTAAEGGGGGTALLTLLVVVVLGTAGAVAYRSGALGGATETDGADGPDGPGEATATEGADDGDDAADDGPAVPDEVLLSDEDRVMGLLEDAGGRMKQVNIVEETGWSKSKVSMLLSEMEEEGQISKLRVGRENIISKKGMEPEAARSPFEDEN
jgi:hypothetical protein